MAHWQSVLQTRLVAEIEESLFVLKVHSGNVTQTDTDAEALLALHEACCAALRQ